MQRSKLPSPHAVLGLVLAILSAACATTSTSVPQDTPPARMGPDAAEAQRLEAIYWSQVESARNRFTEADVDFMAAMIGHHAQALAMVSLVPERSRSTAIQTLARRIDNAQRDEIRLMEQWLRIRDQPVPQWHIQGSTVVLQAEGEATAGHEMAGHDTIGHDTGQHDAAAHDDASPPAHAHSEMPGMLTPEEMSELESASGARFDELFLRYMIQHHEGAVEMVRTLFASDGAAQDTDVFRFASDVQVDQATEIARMERMLQEMSAQQDLPE